MAIWVDADACPNVIKDILFRAAERAQISLTLVANQPLRVPPSRFIRTLRVAQGFDVADNEIVRLCEPGDLVITADIPLAAEVLPEEGEDEYQLIVRVLKESNGVVAGPKGAAQRLGLKRTTLLSRMKRLGINKDQLQ